MVVLSTIRGKCAGFRAKNVQVSGHLPPGSGRESEMPQKIQRLYGQIYTVYEITDSPWTILIKQDENSEIYVPIYRAGWEDGGPAAIFTLLPPAEISDREFLHIRIYTKARKNDGTPGVPSPAVSIQSYIPTFTLI